MRRKGGSLLGMYTLGIAALFLAGFLLLVIFGARTYRDAAAGQADNNDARALLSYVSTCVKSGDSAGGVSIRESDNGPVLVVADGSGYALHIYWYEGYLREEYTAVDAALVPEDASILGPTEGFTAEFLEPDTLLVSTDAGQALLHLRSGEGSA